MEVTRSEVNANVAIATLFFFFQFADCTLNREGRDERKGVLERLKAKRAGRVNVVVVVVVV